MTVVGWVVSFNMFFFLNWSAYKPPVHSSGAILSMSGRVNKPLTYCFCCYTWLKKEGCFLFQLWRNDYGAKQTPLFTF